MLALNAQIPIHQKAMRLLFLIPALFPLLAHAAPARLAEPVERIDTTETPFVVPAIGQVATAEVGEPLYIDRIRVLTKKFKATLKENAESKMDRGYVLSVKAGTSAPMLVRGRDKTWMVCFGAKNTGVVGFFGDRNVDGCLADTTREQVFNRSTFPGYDRYFPLESPVSYELTESEAAIDVEPKFKIQFLYQGLSKGTIKIAYREFVNGMARPAFDQDISYELEDDGTGTIGFKGMRIKVLKATGHNISYILEQKMTKPAEASVDSADAPADLSAKKPWYQ